MTGTLGEIRAFAGYFAPKRWAFCDGSILPTANYAALFALIGNTYGGTKSAFALPNLIRGTVINTGAGPGLSSYSSGQQGGSETVKLTPANLVSHSHTAMVSPANAHTEAPLNNYLAAMVDNGNPAYVVKSYLPNDKNDASQVLVPLHPGTIGLITRGDGHENMMPFLALNYIICIDGDYPQFQ